MSSSTYAHVDGGGVPAADPEWMRPQGSNVQDHILHQDPELGNVAGQQGDAIPQSKHKVATIFHLLFKISALMMYIFCKLFFSNFIIVFVVCVILLAFDFWTVKNVTGRLLVGLRWWNEVREDGTNLWIFESKPDNRSVHPADSLIFWSTLYATPIVWVVLGIPLSGLSIQWLLVVAVAVTLSGANVVGYWKCAKDHSAKAQSFITSRVLAAAMPGAGTTISV